MQHLLLLNTLPLELCLGGLSISLNKTSVRLHVKFEAWVEHCSDRIKLH